MNAPRLILPPQGPTGHEIFLVLPGLNLHPHRLDACLSLLTESGAAVLRPQLTGYAEAGDPAARRVRATHWLSDLDTAWEAARAQLPAARPALLGFSLGALLGLVWAQSRGIPLCRAVLLSPAFRLRRRYRLLIQSLGLVLPGPLRIPSRSPRSYRFHPGTTVAAYRALVRLERRLDLTLRPWLRGDGAGPPPLLLAYSPRDELIDTRPINALAETWPDRVTRVPLSHRPQPGFIRHLGLDAHTLGEAEWLRLSRTIVEWLRRTAPGAQDGQA